MAYLVRVKRQRDEPATERLIIAAPQAKRERHERGVAAALHSLSVAKNQPALEEEEERELVCFRKIETFEPEAAAIASRGGAEADRLIREARRLRKRNWSSVDAEEAAPVVVAAAVSATDATVAATGRRKRKPKKRRQIFAELEPHRDGFFAVRECCDEDDLRLRKKPQETVKSAVRKAVERRLDRAVFEAFAEARKVGPLVELLLANSSECTVDFARPADGTTALMAAAWHGEEAAVGALLARGADPTKRDTKGASAVSLAAGRGFGVAAAALRAASLAKDDYVYDVYAYDADENADDHAEGDGAESDDVTTAANSIGAPVIIDEEEDEEDEEDDDAVSTRCVASPSERGLSSNHHRQKKKSAVIYGIRRPLREVVSLPSVDDDGDSVSSLERATQGGDDDSLSEESIESNDEEYFANDYPDEDDVMCGGASSGSGSEEEAGNFRRPPPPPREKAVEAEDEETWNVGQARDEANNEPTAIGVGAAASEALRRSTRRRYTTTRALPAEVLPPKPPRFNDDSEFDVDL